MKDINPGQASSNPAYLTNANGTLFFSADDGTHADQLWRSRGGAAGTVMVKDIPAGTVSSDPESFTNVDGTAFFTANDGIHGRELWRSNGTGAVLVKDIEPGPGGSYPTDLTNVNGTLFVADDGSHGNEPSGEAMAPPPARCWSRTSTQVQPRPIRAI